MPRYEVQPAPFRSHVLDQPIAPTTAAPDSHDRASGTTRLQAAMVRAHSRACAVLVMAGEQPQLDGG